MQKQLFQGTKSQMTSLDYAIDYTDNETPKKIDFTSWQETHFEVVSVITQIALETIVVGVVKDRIENQGQGGLYELAQELTDEFETLYEDKEWDGEFFDTIESFLNDKLKS